MKTPQEILDEMSEEDIVDACIELLDSFMTGIAGPKMIELSLNLKKEGYSSLGHIEVVRSLLSTHALEELVQNFKGGA